MYRIIVGCLGVAVALSACGEEHKDIPTAIFEAEYSFDPETIQAAIDNNLADLFHVEWTWQRLRESPPLARETRLAPAPDFVPLPWTEADFHRVVNAFAKRASSKGALTE
jgi:hypothetical protein